MKRHRLFGIVQAFLVAAFLYVVPHPAAAKTTDLSDLWWIPGESGWGIELVQEEDTIFGTMFVYGPNGQPTWYVGLLQESEPGALTWIGTVYATTGPWFGTVPFNPAQVTEVPVGTMTLNAPFVNQATLTYSINGVQVVKQIQRETLVSLNFNGIYAGTLSQRGNVSPPCNPGTDASGAPATIQMTQNGTAMSVVVTAPGDTCTLTGAYSQAGHFGQVYGTYTCASGDGGTGELFEMAVSFYDFRARTKLFSTSGCILQGYLDGLKQPPPPQ